MKIIDNTPIENFDTDWGDPDGTGMKEKSKEQVQKFIKGSIKRIEEDAADLKKDNESFKKNVDNQIANQSNEIAVFKKDVTNQIENYKPIEINGNVNNAADEEDLTAENGLIKIANRGTLYGKGYKILRRGVDLQSQFNQENTIYEIRYDFDLNGNTINIPKGCSLVFSGGSFGNGKVTGDFNTANIPENQDLYVFSEGYNINYDVKYYAASNIGMIANDESAAAHNKAILSRVLTRKKGLKLDNTYYIDKGNEIDYVIEITGGEIISDTGLFIIRSGGGVKAKDTIFTGNGYIVDNRSYVGDNHFLVRDFSFENCTFNTICGCYLTWDDNSYSSPEWGVVRLKVFNCTFNKPYAWLFCINNCVIIEECVFSNNKVFGLSETCLYLAYNNEYQNSENLQKYHSDVIFENNIVEGTIATSAIYLTPVLVDSQVNKLYYRNNIVKNLINISKGHTSYDCYGSCNEYYCENNIFTNIVTLSSDGMAEIFKSKASGKLRKAMNNTWSIDYNQCRALCKDKGIEFSDEEFKEWSKIAIFAFTGVIEDVYFVNNKINIKGGALKLTEWEYTNVQNMIFENNSITTDSIVPGKLCPQSITYGKSGIYSNNVIYSEGKENIAFYRYLYAIYDNPNFRLIIKGNRYNGGVSLGTGNIAYADITDNHFEESPLFSLTTLRDCEEPSIININGSYGQSNVGIVFPDLKNAKYIIDIYCDEAHIDSNISLQLKIGDYTGIMTLVDANTTKKFYLKQGKVYDEWDNEIIVNNYSNIYKGESVNLVRWTATNIALQYFKRPKCSLIFEKGAPLVLNETTKGVFRFNGKPTWWNGSVWVDANGEVVSGTSI